MTVNRTLWNGQTIPALGLGCWAIGGPFFAGDVALGWGEVDDNESIAAIHRALDLGVRFFDTASNYGGGRSEEVLGRALEGRNDVLVATKFGHVVDPVTKQALADETAPDKLEAIVHTSLRRLRRERIDLMQLHLSALPIDTAGPIFDLLERLRAKGMVGAYGWSTDFPDRAAAFANREGFVAIQHAMNVFNPATDILSVVEQKGLLSINRSPLAMGLLSGKFKSGEALPKNDIRGHNLPWLDFFKDGQIVPSYARRLERIRDLLSSDGRTLTQGALGWLWGRSNRTLPIPGFRTVAQVEENVGALEKGPLPPEVISEIERMLNKEPEEAR
ncbi:aldo/keto reductase [Cystobacter ferrugineus]|uniref:Aldo/keto reductase n=1 Tax=Cystobacter ferrugineus TaxID=83449 RepID=A0A1L9B544_9BACT|nr:aldo/keto reductase [Cystobacter ferrugineus]OJH37371.1 aldo/keto reductase [Cystobacter ferrugineus]